MSGEKKVRADAVLKNLPEDRQAEIFQLLRDKSLAAVRQHLREDGIRVSLQTLSEFYSWYALRSSLKEAESDTENLLELIKADAPELPEEKLASIGNALFNLRAIKQLDPKLFLAFQTARHRAEMDRLKFDLRKEEVMQRERALQLEREKYQRETCKLFLVWVENEKAQAIVSARGPSNEKKINDLGELMFGDDWKGAA